MRSVKVYEETWPLHTPFVIARGSRSEAHVVVVELEEEGVKGIGECTPYPRYGESDASVMAQIMSIVPQLENGLTREHCRNCCRQARRATRWIAPYGICKPASGSKALPGCSA